MKLHRFFIGNTELSHDFWMDDERLFHQWSRVLRFQIGQQVILFNDAHEERLYEIKKIGTDAFHLNLVTELVPKLPKRDVYLCFSLLKKDKNDWVLQKATELGIRHFVPLLTDRTEKTGFDVERAEKIVTEAAEQCGRADIPRVREPLSLESALKELEEKAQLYIAEQHDSESGILEPDGVSLAVFIGPEGGWSDREKALFQERSIKHLNLSDFTLRAETACISAAMQLTKV